MIRRLIFAFGAVAIAAMASAPSRAEEPAAPPATSPAAEQSLANTSAPFSEEAPRPEQPTSAMSAASQDAEDAAADKPAAGQTPATAEPEKTAEHPAEAEAPASEEAAEAKPEAEPSPAVEPAAKPSMALQPTEPSVPSKPASEPSPKPFNVPAAASAEGEALRTALSGLPAGTSDEEHNEHAALVSFYEARRFAPLWTAQAGFTPAASAVAAEIKRSRDWGLDPRDFALPAGLGAEGAAAQTPEEMAAAEIKISLAILKYGRYARGGRIINPSEQLSSYLDRRPQLLKPQGILDGIAASDQPDAYLHSVHPKHTQFERLRQKYLALAPHNKQQSAEAKRLLANMEEWRWMPDDMGDLYVWNNIPEYTQRVMKDGEVARKEAIVTGQTDKQTPIFSRQLRKITFKPTWIVPDSIKVRELLPNLMRGGSLMREWGLEVLRDGEPINWRKVNWAETDIRNFEVIQPNGPKSVMGKVKFSFPSQHTVFMHDALERDKWMFRAAKRTYSHGCMRVQNPVGLAEILLREDRGWDTARVRESLNKGGNNNEIPMEKKIMVHMTYFTALVDDDGKLHTFPDVYGHERRITLALEGKWGQIVKGRDHLAPVELNEASVHPRHYAEEEVPDSRVWRRGSPYSYNGSFLDSLFGGYGSGYGQYGQYPAPSRQYR